MVFKNVFFFFNINLVSNIKCKINKYINEIKIYTVIHCFFFCLIITINAEIE